MKIDNLISLEEIFNITSGTYHAINELDPGNFPLISCGNLNNGVVGLFDIPEENLFRNSLTVAYNGQPLTTKYHPYIFGTKDDVAILVPKYELFEITLLFIASQLNQLQWKFNYGRKCYREKMKTVQINIPIKSINGQKFIDQDIILKKFTGSILNSLPKSNNTPKIKIQDPIWEKFNVTELFTISRGDFHSLQDLDPGDTPTVSRISSNQGVVGHHQPPYEAKLYPIGTITISTVDGKSFVQLNNFIATDNVLLCESKFSFSLPILLFISLMINHSKWRYSYGRQCYLTKFSKVDIYLPVNDSGEINDEYITKVIENTSYWHLIKKWI